MTQQTDSKDYRHWGLWSYDKMIGADPDYYYEFIFWLEEHLHPSLAVNSEDHSHNYCDIVTETFCLRVFQGGTMVF
jgi:hypothetical protein